VKWLWFGLPSQDVVWAERREMYLAAYQAQDGKINRENLNTIN
jgi:hypothetical protein